MRLALSSLEQYFDFFYPRKGRPAPVVPDAIYHATGKRVHDLPITLDKLQR